MADAVTKTINSHDYEIKPFMGMHGWRIQVRLGKMVGPALKEALGSLPKGAVNDLMKAEIDPAMFGGGVSAFIDAIATNDPKGEFVAELLSQTQRDGVLLSQHEINKVYAANYGEMMKALVAVVVANGFFGLDAIGTDGLSGLMAGNSPAS
jgi:hypothetical protein